MKLIAFLLSAVVVSLSGVMAPGPATAATILAGLRRRHAGLWISLGHGIVEFPLMLLVMWSAALLESLWIRAGVAAAGGTCLLLMGGQMLVGINKAENPAAVSTARHPVWTGVVVSASNPYFILWWVAVGLALCTQAIQFGVWAFVLFAVVHWLCDLAWLEALSVASFKGSTLLGRKGQKVILAVCGAALLLFGSKFVYEAAAALLTAR